MQDNVENVIATYLLKKGERIVSEKLERIELTVNKKKEIVLKK